MKHRNNLCNGTMKHKNNFCNGTMKHRNNLCNGTIIVSLVTTLTLSCSFANIVVATYNCIVPVVSFDCVVQTQNQMTLECKFEPTQKVPSKDWIHENLKTHAKLKERTISGFKPVHHKHSGGCYGSSNLIVVYPSPEWTIKNPMIDYNNHFIIAPRMYEKIKFIDLKWRDKNLNDKINRLATNVSVVCTLFPLSANTNSLFYNRWLLPYFTWNTEVAGANDNKSAFKHRASLIKPKDTSKVVLIQNGLKNLTACVSDYLSNMKDISYVGCLVHLHLDKDYNLYFLDESKDDFIHDSIATSNLAAWFVFRQSRKGIVLQESQLVINNYKWLTYIDIAKKHEFNISRDFNLNYDKLNYYYNKTNTFELPSQSNERISHCSPNQLFELDDLWDEFSKKILSCKRKLHFITMRLSAPHCIANFFYSPFCPGLNILNKNGFQKMFVHRREQQYDWLISYSISKQQYATLFMFVHLSVKNIKVTQDWSKMLTDTLSWIKSVDANSCWEKHYWLVENLQYNHHTDEVKDKIHEYMKNLVEDFPLTQFGSDTSMQTFFMKIKCLLKDYICDQWCMSVFHGKDVINVPLLHIKKYGSKLAFANGFELIVLLRVGDANHPLIVYVNDTVVVCKEKCYAIQLHANFRMKVKRKGVVVCGADNSTLIFVFRRIPTVHAHDAVDAFYSSDGFLFH